MNESLVVSQRCQTQTSSLNKPLHINLKVYWSVLKTFDGEVYNNVIVTKIRHDGESIFWTLHEVTAVQ